jgi:hypothetical protein
MININDCYQQLSLPPLPISYYYDALQAAYNDPARHKFPTKLTTSRSLRFERSRLGKKLTGDFKKVSFDYMRFEPGTYYKFHRDVVNPHGSRLCGINVLLSDSPAATTLFKLGEKNTSMFVVQPVEYVRYQPILLNTQIDHAVLTLGNTNRYILTISVYNQTYTDMLDYLGQLASIDPSYY